MRKTIFISVVVLLSSLFCIASFALPLYKFDGKKITSFNGELTSTQSVPVVIYVTNVRQWAANQNRWLGAADNNKKVAKALQFIEKYNTTVKVNGIIYYVIPGSNLSWNNDIASASSIANLVVKPSVQRAFDFAVEVDDSVR